MALVLTFHMSSSTDIVADSRQTVMIAQTPTLDVKLLCLSHTIAHLMVLKEAA